VTLSVLSGFKTARTHPLGGAAHCIVRTFLPVFLKNKATERPVENFLTIYYLTKIGCFFDVFLKKSVVFLSKNQKFEIK
jgi:hypothetical protein